MEITRFKKQVFMALSKDKEVYFIKIKPQIAVIYYVNLQELINTETTNSSGNINNNSIPNSLKSTERGSIADMSWCSSVSDLNKMYCFVFYQNYIFVFLASKHIYS